MTDWKQVTGSQSEKPLEVDTISSNSTVYMRRNIKEVEVENEVSGEKVTMWQYEERQLTPQEYTLYTILKEGIDEITDFQKQFGILSDQIGTKMALGFKPYCFQFMQSLQGILHCSPGQIKKF